MRVLLVEAAYDRRSPSPLPVPFAIGCLASYAKSVLRDAVQIDLVKRIQDFYTKTDATHYDVVGFGHYVWNATLSRHLAKHLKRTSPQTMIVFGGPQLPIDLVLQEAYVRKWSDRVDVFVEKEGERTFTWLLKAWQDTSGCIEEVKSKKIMSTRSVLNGEFLSAPLAPRLPHLDLVPSPWRTGWLDPFLAQGFSPMIENNRGCPFRCTFCGEGDRYHTPVVRHATDALLMDYDYISRAMSHLPDHPFPDLLYFTDSNTGMYAQDIELCEHLALLQAETGFPKRIVTSTGKNAQEKIIACADLLGGALTLTASVQSTDPQVLINIDRENVSLDVLQTAATRQGEAQPSYSEIILGLPGDSYEKHWRTVAQMADAHIHEISSCQLMILPDTPMQSEAHRTQFGLTHKFRLLVKGAAQVKVGTEIVTSLEHEEICVGTAEMTFDDYLRCRYLDLLVHLFYNHVLTPEVFTYCTESGIRMSDYLAEVVAYPMPPELRVIFNDFLTACRTELYDTEAAITELLAQPDTWARVQRGELGQNLTYRFVAQARQHPAALRQVACACALQVGTIPFLLLIREAMSGPATARYGIPETLQPA